MRSLRVVHHDRAMDRMRALLVRGARRRFMSMASRTSVVIGVARSADARSDARGDDR